MYNARYKSSTGEIFEFGVKGSNVFDIDIGSGLSVDFGLTQRFSQEGDTVETQTVHGKNIPVKGVIYKNVSELRKKMRNIFSPYSHGRLTFDDNYFLDVYVKETPTFSPIKGDGRFTMLLFAPYPYFQKRDTTLEVGEVVPSFKFPVNYETPHIFGIKNEKTIKNVFNGGDVPVLFNLEIKTIAQASDISIKNTKTNQFIKINDVLLEKGDKIIYSRNSNGVLSVRLISENQNTNIIEKVDEGSNLMYLNKGDNFIEFTDKLSKGKALIVNLKFNEAVTSIYED